MVLGFDTSAYTTSLALVHRGQLVGECRRMLPVEKGKRGLRQQEAYYLHHQHLTRMLADLLTQTGLSDYTDLEAVGASTKPRPEAGSFMPVFLAGEQVGRAMATALGLPFTAYDHQRGHLQAALYQTAGPPPGAFYAFHLSGGTTEVLAVKEDLTGTIVGKTLDLSFGQIVDRVGVALGLSFPAGAELEQLAVASDTTDGYKVALKGLDLNLSGVENQALADRDLGTPPAVIAMKVQNTLAQALARMIDLLEGPVLLTGGVMRNGHLRKILVETFGDRIVLGDPAFSSDNALGVALATEQAVTG